MANAIERLRQSYRIRGINAQAELNKRQHTLFQLGANVVLGMAEAKGKKLPEVMGIDGNIVAGVGCLMLSNSVGNEMAKYLQSVADSLLGRAAYEFGKTYASTPAAKGVSDATSMDALLSHVAQQASDV